MVHRMVNAGQPNLEKLNDKDISDSLKTAHQKEQELYQQQQQKSGKGHSD